MQSRMAAAAAFLAFTLACAPLSAQADDDGDAELWDYIRRQSGIWYEACLSRQGAVDPGEWREPIESAFLRIADNSGEPGFSISYAILKDEEFNASCFPGGQFIIHKGTLAVLDGIIRRRTGTDPARMDPAKLSSARESLLAPIIAHELGHYYCRHAFSYMKEQWSMAQLGESGIDVRMVQFSQDNEFEADRTGFLLLNRAGYNPDLLLLILELLNSIQQDRMKDASGISFNVYLSGHPSPHERLAVFQGESRGLHALAADLERAFSDVQLGRNLDGAAASIDKALALAPANPYLRKEKAVALHKAWLLTVALKDQKLRGIIDSPAFRDEMVFSSRAARGAVRALPGDRALWLKAKAAYADVQRQALDPAFDSSFALLLAYSTSAADMQSAVQLAYDAVRSQPTFANASNLGVVLFLTEQPAPAMEILGGIAAEYDGRYASAAAQPSAHPLAAAGLKALREHVGKVQMLDASYLHEDFTPILNLSLLLCYAGRKPEAAAAASDYLARYEAGSTWARYLAEAAGTPLPAAPARAAMSVLGVAIGTPITSLVRLWGKADGIAAQDGGDEEWRYGARNAVLRIQDGVVSLIRLDGPESPRVENSFGVGSTRGEIEGIFGRPKRLADAYTIYEGSQNLAVIYARDVSQRIVLFP